MLVRMRSEKGPHRDSTAGEPQAILTPPSQPISATPAEKLYKPTRPAEPRRGLARDAAFRHGHRSHQQLAPSSEFGSDCVYSAFQMRGREARPSGLRGCYLGRHRGLQPGLRHRARRDLAEADGVSDVWGHVDPAHPLSPGGPADPIDPELRRVPCRL